MLNLALSLGRTPKPTATIPGNPGDPSNPTVFASAANRIIAAYTGRQSSINVDASPPTITIGNLGAASTINGRPLGTPQTAITNIPLRDGSPAGGDALHNWIYGNEITNVTTYGRGGARRFRWTGHMFDFTWPNGNSNYVSFSLRYSENGGPMMWAVAGGDYDDGIQRASGGQYILIDFGRSATWDIEIEWGWTQNYCIGFNFDDAGASLSVSPTRTNPMSFMWIGDSYVYGTGVGGFAKSMVGQFSQLIGAYNGFAHGRPSNRWAKTVDPSTGANPSVNKRLKNGYMDEGIINGALDLIILGGSINDDNTLIAANTNATQLRSNVTAGLTNLRAQNPTSIIAFYHRLAPPHYNVSQTVLDCYRDGFQAALGSDVGAIFIESMVENWIPPGGIGSSEYFPSSNSSTYPLPNIDHPNDAGATYFATRIRDTIINFTSTLAVNPANRVVYDGDYRIDYSANRRATR